MAEPDEVDGIHGRQLVGHALLLCQSAQLIHQSLPLLRRRREAMDKKHGWVLAAVRCAGCPLEVADEILTAPAPIAYTPIARALVATLRTFRTGRARLAHLLPRE